MGVCRVGEGKEGVTVRGAGDECNYMGKEQQKG